MLFEENFIFRPTKFPDGQWDLGAYEFEEGEIEEHEQDAHHQVAHQENKIQKGIALLLQPAVDADEVAQVVNSGIARFQEEVETHQEQYQVGDTRPNDPSPELVLPDKPMGFEKRLCSNDDLFEQSWAFSA